MRKKRLIILCSVLSVFVVLIILASTVFMLQSVSVNFVHSNMQFISQDDAQSIIDSAKFNKGGNVLFMNFKQEQANIEAVNPFVRVVKIERKFPNKAIVHVAERTPAFYVMRNGNAYVFDSDMKLLTMVAEADFSSPQTPAQIADAPRLFGFAISENIVPGMFETNEQVSAIIQKIEYQSKRLGLSILNLEKITFEAQNNNFIMKLFPDNNDNCYIQIDGILNLEDDIFGGLACYFEDTRNNGKVAKIGGTWQFVSND